jgi:hypothetical protein
VRFRIRFSVRFACKSDAHLILGPISRPTPPILCEREIVNE